MTTYSEYEIVVLGQPNKQPRKNKKWLLLLLIAGIAIGGLVYLLWEKEEPIENSSNFNIDSEVHYCIEPASTIDLLLQDSVTAILERKMYEIDAISGQTIVMEVETGEIKAMVGEGKPQYSGLMRTVSLLAALESGKVALTDTFDTEEGVCIIDGEILKDNNWHRGGYGKITALQGFEVTSNITTYKAVDKAFGENAQGFIDMLNKMSYKPEEIYSPQEEGWSNADFAWLSIGYNQLVYPLQMLTFYNAIANNGKMVKPIFNKGETEIINQQIASKANINNIQMAMEKFVTEGLGKLALSEKVKVAGGSGRSQISKDDEEIKEYVVMFCGYFPANKPKYSIIVSMNKMGLPASGSVMAGSVFREIVDCITEKESLHAIKE